MELGGYGFEKSELLKIAEEIYALKSKKQDLELTLHSEQFHSQYIPKRKHLAKHEVGYRLLFIIPMTAVTLVVLFIMLTYLTDTSLLVGNGTGGVVLLFSTLAFFFIGYPTFKLWKREIRMLMLLSISNNPEKAMRFSKRFDLNTFENDEHVSNTRIQMLKAEIANLDSSIAQLEVRQKELIEQKKKGEDFLRKQGILFDENPNATKQTGKFALREESINMGDAQELHEFYLKEEQYMVNYLLQLDGKLQKINKDITQIDDDFDEVKKNLVIAGIIYVLIVLVQGAFSGVLGVATSVICSVVTIFAFFYLENKCKLPIIRYLIEHENSLIQEYAFCHNMVPVRIKREEMLEKITCTQKELDEIKKKRESLVF